MMRNLPEQTGSGGAVARVRDLFLATQSLGVGLPEVANRTLSTSASLDATSEADDARIQTGDPLLDHFVAQIQGRKQQ